jgi:hypothetical protein
MHTTRRSLTDSRVRRSLAVPASTSSAIVVDGALLLARTAASGQRVPAINLRQRQLLVNLVFSRSHGQGRATCSQSQACAATGLNATHS